MSVPLLDSGHLGLLEAMAVFGERRHHVITENLAHVDTVGYRTRDLPVAQFQQALRDIVLSRSDPSSVAPEAPASLSAAVSGQLLEALEAAPRNITFQDANNRSIEHEVMELTKNLMMQTFAVEVMTSQMNLLQAVISERP